MKNLKKDFDLKEELIKKHYHGQEKYGAFSFLNDERDMNLEAADELIDAVNYLIYEAIKRVYGEETLRAMEPSEFNKIYESDLENVIKVSFDQAPITAGLINLINQLKK